MSNPCEIVGKFNENKIMLSYLNEEMYAIEIECETLMATTAAAASPPTPDDGNEDRAEREREKYV